MTIVRERENGSLPVIPDPHEEGLTPEIPGQDNPEFQPDPVDRVDISKVADTCINPDLYMISPDGHRPKILTTSTVL